MGSSLINKKGNPALAMEAVRGAKIVMVVVYFSGVNAYE